MMKLAQVSTFFIGSRLLAGSAAHHYLLLSLPPSFSNHTIGIQREVLSGLFSRETSDLPWQETNMGSVLRLYWNKDCQCH